MKNNCIYLGVRERDDTVKEQGRSKEGIERKWIDVDWCGRYRFFSKLRCERHTASFFLINWSHLNLNLSFIWSFSVSHQAGKQISQMIRQLSTSPLHWLFLRDASNFHSAWRNYHEPRWVKFICRAVRPSSHHHQQLLPCIATCLLWKELLSQCANH